jgi:hypothetical protein
VIAGGQLGHHPTKNPVELDLTEDFMGEQTPGRVQNGRRTLIARGFNCQNSHVALESPPPVPTGPYGRGCNSHTHQ